MTKQTPRFTIDKDQLQQRQDLAAKTYRTSIVQSHLDNGQTATLTFEFNRATEAFFHFHERLNQGWSVPVGMEVDFVNVLPGIVNVSLGGFTIMHLTKPIDLQEKELKEILQNIGTAYQIELDMQREAEVDRVTEQQLSAKIRQRNLEQQKAEQAEREAIRLEVSAAIAGGKA